MSNRKHSMLRHNSIAVGMRAFFEIMEKWGVSNEESKRLLGQPGKSTFHNWKNGEIGTRVAGEFDLASRISYVLGIFRALQVIYERPELADSWVRKPNKAFGGQSALERMCAGQMVDLAAVREYLDSVAEG
jgi:hypothetical protein